MVLIESFAAYAHFLAHFGYMLRVWVCTIESMPSKYTELCVCVGVRTPSRVCAYESVWHVATIIFLDQTLTTWKLRKLMQWDFFRWCFISNRRPDFFFNFMKKWTIFSPFWRETMLWVCNVIFLLHFDVRRCYGCATWSSFYRNGWYIILLYRPKQDEYQLSLHWPQVKHHSNSSTSWYTPQQRLESNGLEKVHFWHFFLKNWNVKAFATHEPK